MVVGIDVHTAMEWRITCFKCHRFGHKGSECKYTTTKERLICPKPGCGRNHHPRDFYKPEKHRESAVTTDKARAPGATSKPSQPPATRPTRSEQSKKNLEASRAMKKAARKLAQGEDLEEEVQTGDGEVAGFGDVDAGLGAGGENGWSAPGDNLGMLAERETASGNGIRRR